MSLVTSRRDFLRGSLLSVWGTRLFLGVIPVFLWKELFALINEKYLLVIADGVGPKVYDPFSKLDSNPGSVLFWNMGEESHSRVDIPFRGHAVVRSPIERDHFFTFEKRGSHMAGVSLTQQKPFFVVKEKRRFFLGHGAVSANGRLIYSSQYDEEKNCGVIGIYDSKTGLRKGEFLSYGGYPHDCQLVGSNIVVINRRGPAGHKHNLNSMTWIDFKSGKLKEEVVFNPERVEAYYLFTL